MDEEVVPDEETAGKDREVEEQMVPQPMLVQDIHTAYCDPLESPEQVENAFPQALKTEFVFQMPPRSNNQGV